MKIGLTLSMIIGYILTSSKKEELTHFAEVTYLKSEKHESWCSWKAYLAKMGCLVKAYATTDSVKKAANVAGCNFVYNNSLTFCHERRLEKMFSEDSQKHKSWCSFKAWNAKWWCKTKAVATTDPVKRAVNLANCDYNYNVTIAACPQRRLDKMMRGGQSKHKSWCSFKAWNAKAWCKTKAIATTDPVKRAVNLANCDYNYNVIIVITIG